jgi:hypothetical protein
VRREIKDLTPTASGSAVLVVVSKLPGLIRGVVVHAG